MCLEQGFGKLFSGRRRGDCSSDCHFFFFVISLNCMGFNLGRHGLGSQCLYLLHDRCRGVIPQLHVPAPAFYPKVTK